MGPKGGRTERQQLSELAGRAAARLPSCLPPSDGQDVAYRQRWIPASLAELPVPPPPVPPGAPAATLTTPLSGSCRLFLPAPR